MEYTVSALPNKSDHYAACLTLVDSSLIYSNNQRIIGIPYYVSAFNPPSGTIWSQYLENFQLGQHTISFSILASALSQFHETSIKFYNDNINSDYFMFVDPDPSKLAALCS